MTSDTVHSPAQANVRDPIALARSQSRPAPTSRRLVTLAGVLAVLWSVLSWFAIEWHVENRVAASVALQTRSAEQGVATVSENLERALNRLQGLAAVVAAGSDVRAVLGSFGPGAEPSSVPRDARMTDWSGRPDLLALSRLLRAAKEEIGVDIIWVMSASGDCVAASNFDEPTTFVGTNYSDRSYFTAARAGQRGRQYAMGRVTKVPGLFFSAPVMVNGRFLGVVAIKNDLTRIAAAVNHPHAFVTDDQGVIILAADRNLEMRALPGAAVDRLPPEQRQSRYMRLTFETLEIRAGGGRESLVQVTGLPDPHVAARSELPQHGVTAHVLEPVGDIAVLRRDAFLAFLLLSFSGIALLALALGVRMYLSRVHQHRQGMESANESLRMLNGHLDHLTKVDPLTGCANRRHFKACLETELGRACRHGRQCSLLAIDIDLFKQVNDRHGHAAGDEALRHFVQVVRGQLRNEDELGRLGGEEFAVLLPETGLTSAMAVAERIRLAIEATPVRFERAKVAFTASLGVACWNSPAESIDALLQRADTALYAAKSGGRNRVVGSGGAVGKSATAAAVVSPIAGNRQQEVLACVRD